MFLKSKMNAGDAETTFNAVFKAIDFTWKMRTMVLCDEHSEYWLVIGDLEKNGLKPLHLGCCWSDKH